MSGRPLTTVLFDVDGTLVDSNDAHAHAWVRAFAGEDIVVPFEAVRRLIGMGGDQLMPRVSAISEESEAGLRIAARRAQIFRDEYLPHLRPFTDAAALVAAIAGLGYRVAAASSAKREELEPLLAIAGAERLLSLATSSDDADRSKPHPDIVTAALERANASPDEAVLIGDTPYDITAGARAGVRVIAFRCGGWHDDELGEAMASYDGPWDLLARLESSPIARRVGFSTGD